MSIKFNAAKMDQLIREDQFLLYEFLEVMKERPREYDKALEIVFNTHILEDSALERKYSKV